jgi:hypothetical protein
VAAQDKEISTKHFKNKIFKEEVNNNCRLCKQREDAINHVTSGCTVLVQKENLMRHDRVYVY